MSVFFVGAGPGDPELITVKGQRCLQQADLVLYAGSLIPDTLLQWAPSARHINTAELTLDEIIKLIANAHQQNQVVVRLQCGDVSLYSAMGEQIRRLSQIGIAVSVVPGVSAASAACAALRCEFTLPEVSQSVVFTRFPGKTAFPEKEQLSLFASSEATLVLFLSVTRLHKVVAELMPIYGDDCPIAVCYRVSWPDETIIHGQLCNIVSKVRAEKINRTALIIVGRVLEARDFAESYLYDANQAHIFRPKYAMKQPK